MGGFVINRSDIMSMMGTAAPATTALGVRSDIKDLAKVVTDPNKDIWDRVDMGLGKFDSILGKLDKISKNSLVQDAMARYMGMMIKKGSMPHLGGATNNQPQNNNQLVHPAVEKYSAKEKTMQNENQKQKQPAVNADMIKNALRQVMTLKGDVPISELIALIDEHKELLEKGLKYGGANVKPSTDTERKDSDIRPSGKREDKSDEASDSK